MSLKIRIGGVPEHFNLPWHLWMEEGGPQKNDLELTWTDFPGGSGAMIQSLESGDLDIALVLTEAIVHAIDQGCPIQPLAVYVESPLIWGIFSDATNPIQSVEGKSDPVYAISRMGSGSHLMARVDAHLRNLKIKDDQWMIVQNLEGAKTALSEQSADLFLWEKWMTRPLVDAGILKMIDERPTPWSCFLLVVRNEFINQSGASEQIRKMVEQVLQIADDVKSNPESPVEISKRYGLKVSDAESWLNHVEWAKIWQDPSREINKARLVLAEI